MFYVNLAENCNLQSAKINVLYANLADYYKLF